MTDPAIHSVWITGAGQTGGSAPPDAWFAWWSFSKTVLAICALRLVEMGRVTLDAPLTGQPYSLRQLLQHTSGVPNYGGLAAYHAAVAAGDAAWPRAALLARVQADRLDFAPGAGWAYSNVGMLRVRMLVEELTGQSYADHLAQVFPGGDFRLAETRADFAGLHGDVARDYDPAWVYHGCLIGPAQAAVRILAGLMRGDLLAGPLMAEMLRSVPVSPGTPDRPWRDVRAGLGLFVSQTRDLGRAIGHPGAGPGSSCGVWHFPDLAQRPTLAAFSAVAEEAVPEWEVIRVAEALA